MVTVFSVAPMAGLKGIWGPIRGVLDVRSALPHYPHCDYWHSAQVRTILKRTESVAPSDREFA
jgi:hypothetical protein